MEPSRETKYQGPEPSSSGWISASIHDCYPPTWPEGCSSLDRNHQHELSHFHASVFQRSETPITPEEYRSLLAIGNRAPYQHDELLLTGARAHDPTYEGMTERIFERSMAVSRAEPYFPSSGTAEQLAANSEVFAILSKPDLAEFLLPQYRAIQIARGDEVFPGRLVLWESQFTRMGYSGRFQFIGKHDHADIGDLVTVQILKSHLEWGDHHKHGHIIEVTDEHGEELEYRVPASQGDLIVEGADVKHRVPKLKDRESRRISLASVWRFERDTASHQA